VPNIVGHRGETLNDGVNKTLTVIDCYSELAMCKQALHRTKEAILDYEASLEGEDGE
jgi:hypothetical protein